jgi:hypothetical protein
MFTYCVYRMGLSAMKDFWFHINACVLLTLKTLNYGFKLLWAIFTH